MRTTEPPSGVTNRVAVEVFGANEQADLEVDLERYVALAAFALEAQGVDDEGEAALFFIDEASIAALNERYLGKQGPTDVLSFPLDDEPIPSGRFPDAGTSGPGFDDDDVPTKLVGDILICPTIAARNAIDHEVSLDDELSLLVVHGVLHLLGWDHQIDAEAEKMEAREREILSLFAKESS